MTYNDNILRKTIYTAHYQIQRKNDKSLGNNNDARFYQYQ